MSVRIDIGTDQLLCEIHDRAAIITLNRPEAHNALSDQLTPALRRMIKECGESPRPLSALYQFSNCIFCSLSFPSTELAGPKMAWSFLVMCSPQMAGLERKRGFAETQRAVIPRPPRARLSSL
jgi:hypothetical protein